MSSVLSLVHPHDTAAERNGPAGDDALVERARRGDVDAFELLYRAHSARVYALCLRLTGDSAKALELAQDVFIRAWEALPEFRGEASMTTWLHRIAVNAMLTRRRGDTRRTSRIALAEDDEDDARALAAGSSPARDVGTAIDLERAIASLPPGARRAFVLHDVEGYSHEEIAEMTGLASGTLRAQLHRARQLLMKALSS
ncbi:MAG TPA: sigma-70 family RNA polymerase sigma factor [Gemmatimonadaceae bacterium]|jgi:RNA polymerase sigma-70 factor (ECF subfamily)|nr:sigma-70 family RNA polymerase sigma factor [Gemmatimonadaceae bacterium]